MKIKILILSLCCLLGVVFLACKEDSPTGPNDLDGDTDIPLTKPGNTYGGYVTVGDQSLTIHDTIYILKNDNGFVTVRVWAETKDNPILSAIIPANWKDAEGNLNHDLHFKVTSNGIQDFRYADSDWSKPFTIVKYDCNVGDKYEFTTKDGKTVTRTITEKTNKDEWPLGFLLIKTIATEETPIGLEGVKKIIYRTNHKFGLVYVELQLTDGTPVKISLLPWAVL